MLLDTLKTMLSVYGPSGNETKVADTVMRLVAGKIDSAYRDAMGNLIIMKKGQDNAKTIMFSAHMDHIAMVVADIEEEGYLRVTPAGGFSVPMCKTRHVTFGNGVDGIMVCQPVKNGTEAVSDLFVDIGAENKEEATRKVKLGDACVFAPDFVQMGEYRCASPAMDDRCACALLCEMLMQTEKPVNNIVAVFSTQEEVGTRGAAVAAFGVNPDWGVALDVTAWGDTPEVKLPAVKLGQGAAIKFMDRGMIATPVVRDALIMCAEKANVPYQREVLPFGSTDAAAIQHSRGGIPAGTVSIPCRYVHSACEVIDMRDMESALAIIKTLAMTAV